MARKRSAVKDEYNFNVPVPALKKHGTTRDPREPISAGHTDADGEAEHVELIKHQEVLPPVPGDNKKAENISTIYAKALVAQQGDVVGALSNVFDVSRDYALANMVALHERARGASRANNSMSDMIERHDLTTEVRLAKVREMLFHDNPAVAMKAIDLINEMDATAKSKRIGQSWESFLVRVKAGLGPKALERNRKEITK
jgi:hypothetical protein